MTRIWLVCLGMALSPPVLADTPVVLVQSTTSTQNSGLYAHLLPIASDALGLDIRVVAVGTGQALRNAERCDGDMLIVHARTAEEEFVAAGFGVARYNLMYNDFVLIGPANDPAEVATTTSIEEALVRIAMTGAPFASRGDDSGTHQKELGLWDGIADVAAASGGWYRETGSGMGATLNIAVGMGAYSLTDRATWLSFENQGSHVILSEGDAALFNQYGVIPVDPTHCPNVNADGAAAFTQWLLTDGQDVIAGFTRDGEQLFFPNAD